jgi:DNA-binding response OmpR family regulator
VQKTVLIVEDEFLIAMDLARIVEADGWTVIGPVGTVEEALRLLEAGLPSVAMLDVNLGNELVTPVAERLKTSNVPFAVASAYDRPEYHGGEVLAGVPNISKPTSEQSVLSTLKQLIET